MDGQMELLGGTGDDDGRSSLEDDKAILNDKAIVEMFELPVEAIAVGTRLLDFNDVLWGIGHVVNT